MHSRLCCWLGIIFISVCELGQTTGLYTPIPGQAFVPKNHFTARGPHDITFADPRGAVVVENRDSLPSASPGSVTAILTRQLNERDVYSPKILAPDHSDVWKRGSTVKISWDTSHPPQHATNSQGTIYLGHLEGGTNEHLDIDHPLAKDVSLAQGNVEVKVPNVDPGNNYIIVLMGDSGNRSPTFEIE